MKLQLTAALALTLLTASVFANDSDNPGGTSLVTNNHGGYNVVQPGGHAFTLPFFGSKGYAAKVDAAAHEPPIFILVPVVQDVGHGDKITVYKRIYFATAEQAEAAKGTIH